MRAMSSAAGARLVPAAFAAAVSAAISSLCLCTDLAPSVVSGFSRSSDQLVEHREGECVQPLDNELGPGEFCGGVAVRYPNAAKPRAACRLETPSRVFDGDAARHRQTLRDSLQQLKCPGVRLW